MIYQYRCEKCDKIVEVSKPMSESHTHEKCECGWGMSRIYSTPSIKTGDGFK